MPMSISIAPEARFSPRPMKGELPAREVRDMRKMVTLLSNPSRVDPNAYETGSEARA